MTDMSPFNGARASDTERAGNWPQWLTRRRILFVAATALIVGGMTLNWGWLTAVGLASILIALAPCGVMCGLGLCMKGGSGKGCSKSPDGVSPD